MRKHFIRMGALMLSAILLSGCSSAPAQSAPASSPAAGSSQEQSLYVNVTPLKPLEVEDKQAPAQSCPSGSASDPVEELPAVQEQPPVEETPAGQEQPPVEETPAVQQQPPVEEKPAVQQQPPVEEKPAGQQQPPVEEKPAVQQPPVEEKPAVQQPPVEEKPAVQQQPPVEEKPAVQQQPPVEEKPAVQQQPPAEEAPAEPVPELPEADALASSPAAVTVGTSCVASGTKEKANSKAVIDYSNTQDGYVMVNFTASTDKRLKVQVKGPTTTYSYNLTPGEWTVFPLSDGNGSYTIGVYENISGNKYSSVLSVSEQVKLTDEFGPFIRPNQYVDYASASKTVAKAKELTAGLSQPLDKVAVIYDYVVSTLSYDYDLASTVKSGYLPNLDKVLAKKSGICFDYAALMTGMLRSQGVPCKLVVGYAGSAYHAWINVWSESTGWINAAIYFDGVAWQRMDPTFASTAKQSEEIMKYIGDGANYSAKYLY